MPRLSSVSSRSLTGIGLRFGPPNIPFNIGTGLNNSPAFFQILPDERILVGGGFSTYNGVTTNNIVILNQDGSKATDINFTGSLAGSSSTVRSIIILSNGQYLIGGRFNGDSPSARRLLRLNSNGSVDTDFLGGGIGFFGPNFNDGGTGDIWSMIQIPGGDVIVGGNFNRWNNDFHPNPNRIDPDSDGQTVLWTGFNGAGTVFSMAEQSENNIIIAGAFTVFRNSTQNRIVKVDSNGTIDETFTTNVGSGFNGDVRSIAIQSDDKIVAVGDFTSFQGLSRQGICRLNSNGTLDTEFNPGTGFLRPAGSRQVNTLKLLNNGKYLVGGLFTEYQGVGRINIAIVNPDGTLDTGFNPGTGFNSTVISLGEQLDGKILVGGLFTSYNDITQNRITRLLPNGTVDSP